MKLTGIKRIFSIGVPVIFFVFTQSSCAVQSFVTSVKNSRNGKLNLSHSHLTEIPSYVFEMKDLTVLNLHNNKIAEVPADIGKLVNLRKLILSRNDITSLPPEIGLLQNLEDFSVKA